jgi:hypothetical protein
LVKDRNKIFKKFVRDENTRNNEYFQVLFETEANKAGELKLRNATYSITPRATNVKLNTPLTQAKLHKGHVELK